MPVAAAPSFLVFVSRVDPPEGPYRVRFETQAGKGALRLARPGVLIEQPARARAEEAGLATAQLRSARFLFLPESGAARQVYSLLRVDPQALTMLPKGEWVPLTPVHDKAASFLLLPAGYVPAAAPVELLDEPTTPMQILAEFRAQVEAAVVRARTPGETDALAGAAPTEPRRSVLPEEPTELPKRQQQDSRPPNLAPLPDLEKDEADPWQAEGAHARPTTAVRFLRRKVAKLEQEKAEAVARAATAEAQLAALVRR